MKAWNGPFWSQFICQVILVRPGRIADGCPGNAGFRRRSAIPDAAAEDRATPQGVRALPGYSRLLEDDSCRIARLLHGVPLQGTGEIQYQPGACGLLPEPCVFDYSVLRYGGLTHSCP